MPRTIGIYIFDEIEVLDLGGPFEVFSTASRMKARLMPDAASPFEVFTIAESIRPIRARGGLMVRRVTTSRIIRPLMSSSFPAAW